MFFMGDKKTFDGILRKPPDAQVGWKRKSGDILRGKLVGSR